MLQGFGDSCLGPRSKVGAEMAISWLQRLVVAANVLLISCTTPQLTSRDTAILHQTSGGSAQFSGAPFDAVPGKPAELLYSRTFVRPDADGRPRIFFTRDLGKSTTPILTLAMKSSLYRIAREIRPQYRRALAFLFAGAIGRQFFVVFLDGYPQYPALNICRPRNDLGCHSECALFVDPITRRVTPSTIPKCAERMPIWQRQSSP